MILRLAVEGDEHPILDLFQELDHLHVEALPTYFQVPYPSQRTPEAITQAIHDPQHRLVLAIDHSSMIGIAWAHIEEEPRSATSLFRSRKLCWLRKLMVKEQHRGRGIGRQLMEHIENWTTHQGINEVELLGWTVNQAAYDFYAALGYTPRNSVLGRKLIE